MTQQHPEINLLSCSVATLPASAEPDARITGDPKTGYVLRLGIPAAESRRFEVRDRLGNVVGVAWYDPANGLEAPPLPEPPAPPAHDFDPVNGFCRRCDMSEAEYYSNFGPCPEAQLFSVWPTQLENRSEQQLFESGEASELFGVGSLKDAT